MESILHDPYAFVELHGHLQGSLESYFHEKTAGFKPQSCPNGTIHSMIRLSCAIQYFVGGKIYDIMSSHGVWRTTVYDSVDGVIDCINKCSDLAIKFPTHKEQHGVAAWFAS